jgi:hypothetical protein
MSYVSQLPVPIITLTPVLLMRWWNSGILFFKLLKLTTATTTLSYLSIFIYRDLLEVFSLIEPFLLSEIGVFNLLNDEDEV